MIPLESSQSVFWLSASFSILFLTGFICWVLFEVARLARQGNEIVEHLRDLLFNIEQDFLEFKERFGVLLGDVAGMAKGIKAISGWMSQYTGSETVFSKKSTKKTTRRKRYNSLLEDEEEV